MASDTFEYKSTALSPNQAKAGAINLDEAQGIVECFVAGIGNKDSVGDIVATGAFTKSLQRRKPRVVWGHSWNDPIGKVLEIYEVPNTDPRLPMKMKVAGIGGLFARVQFNLGSDKGREAFASVAFFGEEQEWSIGYKTLRAQFDQKSQANVIYELELYEVSPVLHGANQLTGTISVKSEMMDSMVVDEEDSMKPNIAEIEKQLSAILGTKVSVMDVSDDEVTFARRMGDGEVGRYKCHFGMNRGRMMFGNPEPIVIVQKPTMGGMPMAPVMPVGSPGIPMNEPRRVVRPSQMPSMPVAIKPGENGPQMVPLPTVEYENSKPEKYDPNNLDKEESDLRDALLKIVARHGKFNEDSEGVWAGYRPAAENRVASIGVKCANCVFYQGAGSCKIIDMDVEPEGKCRFAVIPKGVVKGDVVAKKTYEIESEINEEEYIEDLEVKYPGELLIAAVRGAVKKRRKKRRRYKELFDFGTEDDDFEEKAYILPVLPQYAFRVKQALDPIFDYHRVESFVDPDGIVMTSGVSYDLIDAIDTALTNLKKKSLNDGGIEEKAAGFRLGRAIGSRLIDRPNIGGGRSARRFFTSIGAEDFDPFTARDANLNGIVGEGIFLRGQPLAQVDPTPDGPGSIRNPKPSREQIRKPAEKPNLPDKIVQQAMSDGEKGSQPKLSSGYKKYLDTPIEKRKLKDIEKYNGPVSAALASGKIKEKQVLKEGSPELEAIYKKMGEQFIAALEELQKNPDKKNWDFPWRRPDVLPKNPTTRKFYKGRNALLLSTLADNRGQSSKWAGITQWRRYGGKLKPGAAKNGVEVVVPLADNPLYQKTFKVETVYNIDDIIGLPPRFYEEPNIDINEEERLETVEQIVKEIAPKVIERKSAKAFFSPSQDVIVMPKFSQFENAFGYYSTLLHESIHWTGHPSRLDRTFGLDKEDPRYAFEELVAEIGSSFALGLLGLQAEDREDHLVYVDGWIQNLRDNPNALEEAIRLAQMANDFLLSRSPTFRRVSGFEEKDLVLPKPKEDIDAELPDVPGDTELPDVPGDAGESDALSSGLASYFDEFDSINNPTSKKFMFTDESRNVGMPNSFERKFGGDIVQRGESGAVMDGTGRLSSGKTLGEISPVRGKGPKIKRTDASISMRHVYNGIKVEPTQQQRDIIDTAVHLILNGENQVLAINAGAGTGKTTTLKSIANALATEFSIGHITDEKILEEKLKHLSDKYGINLQGKSRQEIESELEKLKKKFGSPRGYYAVFGKKNQQEAEVAFPSNTGVATTAKIYLNSLLLGGGDAKYGKGMRTKARMTNQESRKSPKKTAKYKAMHFDGRILEFEGRSPGWKDLGYIKLEDGKDWVEFLGLIGPGKMFKSPSDAVTLPNGAQISAIEFGDLLRKAMRRWSLDVDEKVKPENFELSDLELEEIATTLGAKKRRRGQVSLVDSNLSASSIPKEWVGFVQKAVDTLMDGDSNLLPTDEMPKLWMMTKPDLRTDPGLVAFSTKKLKQLIPDNLEPGDTWVDDKTGQEFVVLSIAKSASKNRNYATVARRMASKDNPLNFFMVDEAQDMNPIFEQVLQDNRDKLQIILVGDERQSILGFQDAKDILTSMEPEYNLQINESFRYGEVIAYLANLLLGKANRYRASRGQEQASWKHVRGMAPGVVNKDFSLLTVDGKENLKGAALEKKVQYLARKYEEDKDTILSLLDMSDSDRAETVGRLAKKYRDRARGRIVYADDEIAKGNLPTMILTRSNTEIVQQAVDFVRVFQRHTTDRDKDGNPIIPTIVIPAKKHAELVNFVEHYLYAQMSPEAKREYEKRNNGRPKQSSIIGPVWDAAGINRRLFQKQNQQLRTFVKLVEQGNPARGIAPVRPLQLKTMLLGKREYEVNAKGERKLKRIIPPTMIAERDTQDLDEVFLSIDDLMEIANRKSSTTAPRGIADSQLMPWEIIKPQTSKMDGRVTGRLLIEGIKGEPGPDNPGKWNGKIVISGQGLDTNRPSIIDGVEVPGETKDGIYRRDMMKIIEKFKLQDKVKAVEESGLVTAAGVSKSKTKRRNYDGFVIEGETPEESLEIYNLVANELRKAAGTPGGDVEITTATLSKGRESRFVVIAPDFTDPAGIEPADALLPDKLRGKPSKSFMEELNLIYVALTRAQEMIDPGTALMDFYLNPDGGLPDILAEAIKEGAPDGDGGKLSKDLDLSEIYRELLPGRYGGTADDSKPAPPIPKTEDDENPVLVKESDEGNEDFETGEAIDESDDETEAINAGDIDEIMDNLDSSEEGRVASANTEDPVDDGGDDEDGQASLSSGRISNLSSGSTGNRLARRQRDAGRAPRKTKGINAARIAGIRIDGDPDSPANRRAINYSMQVWDGFRRTGIALDAPDVNSSGDERNRTISAGMRNIGKRMADKPGIKIGNVSENASNNSPSAENWMLPVNKLIETIRIPTEFRSRSIDGQQQLGWSQSRPITVQELGQIMGLGRADVAKLEQPGAGINHDAVRYLVSEIGKEPQFSGWRLFAPITRDEIGSLSENETVSPVELFAENTARANMRDRFIIETFGKDAYPHWFDVEENESISPDDYDKLGEVSERSKFRALGRFYPDSATRGDSEAEVKIYEDAIDEIDLGSIEPDIPEADVKADKTSRKDFDLEPLLDYLGISKEDWNTKLRDRLREAFGTENVGLSDKTWAKDGIPTAYISQMIRTGVIPNASDVWKDGDVGGKLDDELSKSKHVVYEAVNEFIDKSFPNSRLNNERSRRTILDSSDMRQTLKAAAAAKGSAWSPKKGDEPRFSDRELGQIVTRFNQVFGTNHTIDDIFSREQLDNARRRIEVEGTTLSQGKRSKSTKA